MLDLTSNELPGVAHSERGLGQKKAPTEAGAGDALMGSVCTEHSKILPLPLARRLPKSRIGDLRKRKRPRHSGGG